MMCKQYPVGETHAQNNRTRWLYWALLLECRDFMTREIQMRRRYNLLQSEMECLQRRYQTLKERKRELQQLVWEQTEECLRTIFDEWNGMPLASCEVRVYNIIGEYAYDEMD